MNTRRQLEAGVEEKQVRWDAKKTAIVVCDMWNEHWCKGATERVAEMAPRMNEVLKKARAAGVLIIHAPSETMKFYEGTPMRKLAQAAPVVEPVVPLERWCRLDPSREGPLPIDDSDGGCDDSPQCKGGPPYPWTRQIAALDVLEGDAVTDNAEAYYLMQQRGIENVIVMGVHANMCVLGRPFSIRQMVKQGKNVLLMRDMTDTMYNSRMRPFVNHFAGNDLVVRHIERYWAASITSAEFLGGEPFKFKADPGAKKLGQGKKVVFMIGEPEYNTAVSLPEFAKSVLDAHGIDSIFVHGGTNGFPGLEALKTADLLVLSVRRMGLKADEMKLVRDYLKASKPMVAIRTSSHAFELRPPNTNGVQWVNFDWEVLGADYEGHYGKGSDVEVKPTAEGARNEILTGVAPVPFKVKSHLYKYPRTFHTATVLMNGKSEESKVEPVAWINSAENRRVFYTSLGSVEDFATPQFRRLLLNGVLWSLELPIPGAEDAKNRAALDDEQSLPLAPAEALKAFKVAEDLVWEQVLAEPVVQQPLHLSFDERGRLWVVNYIQYPNPAGLKMVSRDNFWRAVYDKVPAAPPNHVRGLDKITIHEDTDGDGAFDKHKTFVDGLSIATSVAVGADGVWVLNPPYLQFYPDANKDDVPDGPPVTHLAGFGLEDTHSVANSLRWGPDGWLYAAQGSTVSANITRPGIDKEPVRSMGQLIWRYHPPTKRYEIFAEGGGNAFGLEIDAKGRTFSGHNGGNTRGFHYVQGGYSQKGFEKHGPLSNPFAFGYFKPMTHPDVDRFTHAWVVYESDALPEKYHGKMFGVEPLQGRIVMSEISPEGSSFKTRDLGHPITTTDKWFRPVDIKQGPDGAIYVADWYDRQVNHYRNHEGQVDPSNGRVYRLRGSTKRALAQKGDVLERLQSKDKAVRQSAWQLAASVTPAKVRAATGQEALELLWALNRSGKLDETSARELLSHADPFVRQWTVRLLGDRGEISQETARALAAMAPLEPNLYVRSQLASAARRLRAADAMQIVRGLAQHGEDARDIHLPLLTWWAVEAHAAKSSDEIFGVLQEKEIWAKPAFRETILERLMRRFTQAGTRQELLRAAKLFELSPDAEGTRALERGFEQGVKGRPLAGMPKELVDAMRKAGVKNEAIALRVGEAAAVKEALGVAADSKQNAERRQRLIEIFGETKSAEAFPVLLAVAGKETKPELLRATFAALAAYEDARVAEVVGKRIEALEGDLQLAAINLLASRQEWLGPLLTALESGKANPKSVPQDIVTKIRRHEGGAIMAQKLWGVERRPTTEEMQVEIDEVARVVRGGAGNPYEGFKVFSVACGSCHKLFGKGGEIGPDLTSYKRDELENLLLAVVNPNAEIREGYVNHVITAKDGRTLSGFIADEDNQAVVVRGIDGITQTIPKSNIAAMTAAGFSLMPEGLLKALDETQVRDLFAYVRSAQPLVP